MRVFNPIFWSLAVLAIGANIVANFSMKIRVNGRLPEQERFSWWSRNFWAVARKYAEFYPESDLPMVGQFSFWVGFALGAAFLANKLWNSN